MEREVSQGYLTRGSPPEFLFDLKLAWGKKPLPTACHEPKEGIRGVSFRENFPLHLKPIASNKRLGATTESSTTSARVYDQFH